MGQTWSTNLKLVDIANKIPEFISEFLKNLKEGTIYLSGAFYLGEKYDLGILESLPVHIQKVKEIIIVDYKEKEFNKLMVISDMFFCLFDQERWSKSNFTLSFWSNIKALVTIKKTIKGNTCRFFWKQKNKKV